MVHAGEDYHFHAGGRGVCYQGVMDNRYMPWVRLEAIDCLSVMKTCL